MSICHRDRVAFSESPWSDSPETSTESSQSSSTPSWLEEAEESLAKDLREQYEKFEEALYSERPLDDLPKSLQAEVKMWSEHSLHLRVRGVKAKLHERPEDYIEEEEYDPNFEEIIESHGSLEETLERSLTFNEDVQHVIEDYTSEEQEIIKTDLKNAIVDKLLGHALPKVLEKVEPVIKSVSAGKRKISPERKSELYLEKLKNRENEPRSLRSKSSRSYMNGVMKRKPLPTNESCLYQSALSSRGYRRPEAQGVPDTLTSVISEFPGGPGVPVAKMYRTSNYPSQRSRIKSSISFSKKNSDRSSRNGRDEKATMLPIIEAVSLIPQSPDKRSTSAMVRFNKTLPRVGANTARQKSPAKKPTVNIVEPNNNIRRFQPVIDKPYTDLGLQVVGTRSATSQRNNKWRY